MKKYFSYLFKKNLLQTTIVTVLLTFIFAMIVFQEKSSTDSYLVSQVFSVGFAFGAILTGVVMILRFNDFKNEKASDLYFSLPISKKKIHITQYLFGLMQILIAYTVMYLLGLIIFIIISRNRYVNTMFILMYVTHLPFLVMFYTIFTVIFLKSNNSFDGVIFVLGWLLFSLILGNVANIFDNSWTRTFPNNSVDPLLFTPFYGSTYFNIYLQESAGGFTTTVVKNYRMTESMIHSAVLVVLTGLSMYGGLKQIDKQKTEDLGRISTTSWGYYFLIPASILGFSITLFAYSIPTFDMFGLAFLIVLGFVAVFIFKRGFRIKWYDSLLVLLPIVIGVIIALFIK